MYDRGRAGTPAIVDCKSFDFVEVCAAHKAALNLVCIVVFDSGKKRSFMQDAADVLEFLRSKDKQDKAREAQA